MWEDRPARGFIDRLRHTKMRVIKMATNDFEPFRVLTDALELAGRRPPLGEAPIETAELAKPKTMGTMALVNRRFGRVYREMHDAKLTDEFDEYLSLKNFQNTIAILHADPSSGVTPDGRTATGGYVNPRQFDLPKTAAALVQLRGQVTPAQWAAIEDAATRWWSVPRYVLDRAHDAGIVSDAAYTTMIARGDQYTPRQSLNWLAAIAQSGLTAETTRAKTQPYDVPFQDYLRSLEGTEDDLRRPTEASMDKALHAIALIERNRAARAVTDLSSVFPRMIRELPGDVFKVKGDWSVPVGQEEMVVSAFVDGHRKNYAVPVDIGAAMKFLDAEQLGTLAKVLSLGKNILTIGTTGANLAFALPNAKRDLEDLLIYNRYGLTHPRDLITLPIDFVEGLVHVIRGSTLGRVDPIYDKALVSGALFGGRQTGLATPSRSLKDAARIRDWYDYMNVPNLLLRAVQEVNSVIEETPKVTTVMRAEKRFGATPAAAGYEAAVYGGSPPFRRGSSLVRALSFVFMFLNPRVQGTARAWRRLKGERPGDEHARNLAWTKLGIVALISAINWAWNQQWDDDIGMNEVSDSDLWRYSIVLQDGTYQHSSGETLRKGWKIAKSETVAVVDALVRAGLDWLKGNEPDTAAKLAANLIGGLSPISMDFPEAPGFDFPTLKSIGAGGLASLNPELRLPVELTANYQGFGQRPIVPRGLENVLPPEQVTPSTSPTMAAVGRLLNMSPKKLEYGFTSGTGGVGRGILDAIDRFSGRAERDVATAYESAARQPILSRIMLSGGNAQDARAERRFYTALDEARRIRGSVTALTEGAQITTEAGLETPRGARLREVVGDPGMAALGTEVEQLDQIAAQLGEVRKLQAFLVTGEPGTVAQRQNALKLLAEHRHQLLGAFRVIERELATPAGVVP